PRRAACRDFVESAAPSINVEVHDIELILGHRRSLIPQPSGETAARHDRNGCCTTGEIVDPRQVLMTMDDEPRTNGGGEQRLEENFATLHVTVIAKIYQAELPWMVMSKENVQRAFSMSLQ